MSHVLVTGGAGFIGSHLAEQLVAQGNHVVVIDDLSTGFRENLDSLLGNDQLRFVEGSVADRDLLREHLEGARAVYHLAAAVGVRLIAEDPVRTIETNIHPTELLLQESLRVHEQRQRVKLLLASSSEVYGKNPKPKWSEDDDLVFGSTTRPRWAYGASKAIDEFLGLGYWRQHELPVVVCRFFNVVGPRQVGTHGMVLPRFVQAAMNGGPLIVHGDGKQVRCFADVGDVVEAITSLMEHPETAGNVYNVGSDEPVSIGELAAAVIQTVDPRIKIEFQSYAEAFSADFDDVRVRVPNLTRLETTIGERPKRSLNDAIDRLVQWHRQAETSPQTRG